MVVLTLSLIRVFGENRGVCQLDLMVDVVADSGIPVHSEASVARGPFSTNIRVNLNRVRATIVRHASDSHVGKWNGLLDEIVGLKMLIRRKSHPETHATRLNRAKEVDSEVNGAGGENKSTLGCGELERRVNRELSYQITRLTLKLF
jgi:hypothetical protein